MKPQHPIATAVVALLALVWPGHAATRGGDVDLTLNPTMNRMVTSVAVQSDGSWIYLRLCLKRVCFG